MREKSPWFMGTPSITYSGSLPPEMDDEPRTRTLMAAPGVPEFCVDLHARQPALQHLVHRGRGDLPTVSGRSDETAPATLRRRSVP
jgi:hypothetical protein